MTKKIKLEEMLREIDELLAKKKLDEARDMLAEIERSDFFTSVKKDT